MTNIEIIDGLEALFANDGSVEIEKNSNSISFSQKIGNVPRVGGGAFRKINRRYTHTVTLKGDTYKTEDLIEVFNLGEDKPRTGYNKGDLHDEGFRLIDGEMKMWNTDMIKIPVQRFMEQTGLRKEKRFWTGKKIALLFACIWIPIIIAAVILVLCL